MSGKRLLQVFITHKSTNPGPGIFEVSTNASKKLSCTCPGFIAKAECKHADLVGKKIESAGGVYPFDFSEKVTTNDIRLAMESEELFRDFIIKYAKIEVY
jgi:hypothetical protein